jgi:uncharacterized protein YbaA (DUF1428 family)
VPEANKTAYLDHARTTHTLFKEQGALRIVDAWGDDVPDGKVTDFKRAVQAKDGEAIVFSWIEWPDKATRDAGMAALMEDERMNALAMPFDGKRMIYGGFTSLVDSGNLVRRVTYSLNIDAIGVFHESAVVVLVISPKTRLAIVGSPRRQRGGVECINL